MDAITGETVPGFKRCEDLPWAACPGGENLNVTVEDFHWFEEYSRNVNHMEFLEAQGWIDDQVSD